MIFDPEEIGVGPIHFRDDLPTGASRLYAEADGIEHVLVNGVEIVRGREFTGATPGTKPTTVTSWKKSFRLFATTASHRKSG